MGKGGFFRSFWLRASLGVLAWEVALIALTWFLRQKLVNLQHLHFGDCLFGMGAFLLAAAGFGMLSRPFEINNSPWGRTALPVQDSEEEKGHRLLAEFVEQRAFALRLAAIGLLMILISLAFTYVIR